MSIDITGLKVKSIDSVSTSYSESVVVIDLDTAQLAEAVPTDEIVNEYDHDDLLDEIGETTIIKWLEREGYTVTNE